MRVGVTIKDQPERVGLPPQPYIVLYLLETGDVSVEAAGGFSPDHDGLLLVADTLEDVAEAMRHMDPVTGEEKLVELPPNKSSNRPMFSPVSLADGKPI